ncbi:iron ABC transporter permease [Treponema sp.]|uniref:ABC transporter permease n=1 Tax=Treponema sp. TaxID=166 RepID=UPI00298EA0B2|nr:iron ABC transporter permease [Treponema sp.]MCQ2240331.1 iron ABC transporter permease [Treponema sp.]
MNKTVAKEKDILLWFLWGSVIAVLAATMLFPLLRIFAEVKTESFAVVFNSRKFLAVMGNSVRSAFWGALVSVVLGYGFAYAVVVAKVPFSKYFAVVPVLHLITPPFVGGLSFILLAGRQGFITKTILGLDVSLYGFWGLLVAQVLCFFPIAFLICAQNLGNMNRHFAESALSLGAGRLRIFFTVTLPLSLPGISASFLFILVSILSDFGNPLIVAGRYKVLAVEIYTQLTGWVDSSISVVLGIILLVPSVILFLIQAWLVKKYAIKTATVGGRVSSCTQIKSSAASRIILFILCGILSFIVIAQFASIVAGSFQKLWGINTTFTMNHITSVARHGKALFNSISYALIGAALSTILAFLASFFVHRSSFPLKKTIDVLIQIPAAIPGTFHGLAISLLASALNFHNARVLVIAAISVGFIPFSYRIISSSMMQIRTTLDDAALSLGSTRTGICGTIIAPLCSEGILSSFIYTLSRGIGTVSAVIFLVSFDTPLASLKILNLAEQGDWGQAASLALVLTVLTFAILLAEKLLKRRFYEHNS